MTPSTPRRRPASREPRKLKVFLDATVLIAGTVWPRWSYEVLQHARRGDFQLVLSERVINSTRNRLAAKFPSYAESLEQALLPALEFERAAEPELEEVAANQKLVRQLTDVPVALAAINAGVDYFVSDDKDFTDEVPSTALVRSKLNILRPVIFLREMMGWSSEELEKIRKRRWSDLEQS